MKYILGKIFLFFSGWKINKSIPEEVHGKSVMICAPHTSNWDFPLAVSVMSVLKVKIRFTIKKEWVKYKDDFCCEAYFFYTKKRLNYTKKRINSNKNRH
jgi:hypothetical protein